MVRGRRAATDSQHRVLLRLPAPLHRRLTEAAERDDLSFNEYCVRRLAGGVTGRGFDAGPTLDLARHLVGAGYLGAIVHGSWARGEARDGSDIDVLVVVDRQVTLSRRLYATWDAIPVSGDGPAIDVHFVQLPDGARPGAVWCEAALDGVVLDDPRDLLCRALYDVRRAIAEGRVVRRTAHGQSYWTTAA